VGFFIRTPKSSQKLNVAGHGQMAGISPRAHRSPSAKVTTAVAQPQGKPDGQQLKENMKKICIVVGDDGAISVGIEPQGEAMGEGMEVGEDQSYLQPAESPEAAMEMVMQLMGSDERSPEEQMQAGYAKGRPGLNPAKVLGG